MKRPPAIEPGDRIRVIAPSSPPDGTLLRRGIAGLEERYEVVFEPDLFDGEGYLAGNDERRAGELARAIADERTRAIVAARGGYGLMRIVRRVDLLGLARSPKWLVGFSDFTTLHVEAARLGLMSLHAPSVACLGRRDADAREAWRLALECPEQERRFTGLEVWQGGVARGPLFGGNLTTLFSCAAAARLLPPPGAVLVLEDVGESSYRIDRMLSALSLSGLLERISAVVVGDFTNCADGRYGVPAEQVLRERLGILRVPVLSGLPLGHGRVNAPLCLGATATVDATHGELRVTHDES